MKDLFGGYWPGDSWVHNWPLWLKYLVLLGATGAAIWSDGLLLSAVSLTVVVLVLSATRIPIRHSLGLPWPFVILVASVAAYHWWFERPILAVTTGCTWIVAVYGSRIVTMTTPTPKLLDGLTRAIRPLGRLGLNVEAVSLAIALMLRSVPYLFASFQAVRDAARARGLERSLWAQITPVVVGAVAYAQRTGEAVVARDLLAGDG